MTRSRLTQTLCSLLLLTLALVLPGVVPVGAAPRMQGGPPFPDAEWAAWGLSASFEAGAPRIKFAAYVGKSGNPPVVLGKIVEDITAQCDILDANGNPTTLSINGSGYANFDGNVYLACQTPDWQFMITQLAPHLRPARGPTCECSPTKSPFWAASELVIHPVAAGASSMNPLVDASELGLTFSLPTTGSAAQSQLSRSNGTYTSGTWVYDPAGGNRVLVGQNGPIDVAIIEHFGGLSYLTSTGWRPYFINTIRGPRFGQWLEPANSGSFTNVPTGNYTLTTLADTVYIGRHNSTGAMLNARVRKIEVDPGCYGG